MQESKIQPNKENRKGLFIIFETGKKLLRELEKDLSGLGYKHTQGEYQDTKVSSLINLMPQGIIIGLTEWDDDRLNTCEILMQNDLISKNIPIIAVFSENTINKVPLDFNFTNTIIYPYKLSELNFRINRTVYQYRQISNQKTINIGDLTIIPECYEVRVKGELLDLTFKEFELLRHLIVNRGRVFTRDTLLNTIWGYDYYGGTRTIDVHIRRLRAKIGDVDETYIKTVRGVGYTFRSKV
ncbi:MAG: winged helix-turn-helix domain-containing protein [Peptococcaceae bacterium]